MPFPASTLADVSNCPPNTAVSVIFVSSAGTSPAVQTALGAENASQCLCSPGFYDARLLDSTITAELNSRYFIAQNDGQLRAPNIDPAVPAPCLPCPDGANCLGNVLPPVARTGYGILSAETARDATVFFECLGNSRCPGSNCDCVAGEHTAWRANTTEGARVFYVETDPMVCGEGYVTGSPLCATCDWDLGYASAMSKCEQHMHGMH